MKVARALFGAFLFISFLFMTPALLLADPPTSFDLRDVGGTDYVSSVKSQQGGTCWTHGAAASMEGNMLMTGIWLAAGESGEPNLAEYHLDWWNGFNQNNNDDLDPPTGAGLEPHEGGDYLVTSAYLARGEGAVRDIDAQSFTTPPARFDTSYHYFYTDHIEWLVAQPDLSRINEIKERVMAEGVVGTSLCYDANFMVGYVHYQPPSSTVEPNHAVAIIGWDDDKATHAPSPGAWLIKNSWGAGWGEDGYFWISYYDKCAGQHDEMGAISFRGVGPMPYDKFYFHDYHGWRDTKTDISEAFNAFTAAGEGDAGETMRAVNFFTCADSVDYIVRIYDTYSGGALSDLMAETAGSFEHRGLHTVTLSEPLALAYGNDFFVYVSLSAGGHAFDRTSLVPVLLGAKADILVESAAAAGESYYLDGSVWTDLFYNTEIEYPRTANFCIKAMTTEESLLDVSLPDGLPEYVGFGENASVTVQITDAADTYVPGSGLMYYRFDGGTWLTTTLTSLGGDLYEGTLPVVTCEDTPEYYFSMEASGGGTITIPPDAPATVFTIIVGAEVVDIADNFETDLGWTTDHSGVLNGFWQRGTPVDDPGWDYDPTSDADGSGQCYLTENVAGNTDVDGGSVSLISPSLDLSLGGNIGYDYYLFLTDAAGGVDHLLVEISETAGSGIWVEIARHDTDGGLYWRHHDIPESVITAQGVTLTSNMQLRFTVNDSDPQSIVEAGLDALTIFHVECTSGGCCGEFTEGVTGNANCSDDGKLTLSDITRIIDRVYISKDVLCCEANGNTNGDVECQITLSDITKLIDAVYISHELPAACMIECE